MFLDAELKQKIDYELKMLENARKEYATRLEFLQNFQDVKLKRTKPSKGRRYYYYVKRQGSKSFKYIGKSDTRLVQKVREARFLEEAIRRIDRDIVLMKSLIDGFLPFDPSSIRESLPVTYQCQVPPASDVYTHEGKKWKADRLEFQKGFPENYPEHKKHRTSDGVMVKTISELVVYEKLKDAGLSFIYELPLPMDDYGPPLYPDFKVLSPIDMKSEIIIEFVGRLDKYGYRDDFAWKVGRYIESGYEPGVNLFFIFGDKDGNFDSTQVTKVIADIKGFRG